MLGVDIDGVLADSLPFIARALGERLGRPVPIASIVRLHHPDNAALAAVFDAHDTALYEAVPPMPGAAEALRALAGAYRIHLVTARPAHVRDVTLRWLERAGIPFDELDLLAGGDKAAVCLAAGIGRFVEDSPENGARIAQEAQIPVALLAADYNADYNRVVSHPLVTRLAGWPAVVRWATAGGAA